MQTMFTYRLPHQVLPRVGTHILVICSVHHPRIFPYLRHHLLHIHHTGDVEAAVAHEDPYPLGSISAAHWLNLSFEFGV
ncbi:hypothetical protein M1O12_02725 [Dehalococcoidia bacterium]|nr:hypothetical protein [Dehalococcoidia bacterium]